MEAAGNGTVQISGGQGEQQLMISGVGGDQPLVMSAEDAAQFLKTHIVCMCVLDEAFQYNFSVLRWDAVFRKNCTYCGGTIEDNYPPAAIALGIAISSDKIVFWIPLILEFRS